MEKEKIFFPKMVTLLFMYLKLTHQIDWSWWLVLAPVLIGAIISATIDTLKQKGIVE